MYEAHRSEVTQQLLQMAGQHPELAWIVQNAPARPPAEENAAAELQRKAIFHGDWEPYLRSLQAQGMQYAQSGLSFHAWFELVSAFRSFMRPHLLEAYGSIPPRLLSAMNGVDKLVEIILSIIGDSYLEVKQQIIRRQEAATAIVLERIREEEKFRALLESAPDGMVIVDSTGRIVLANARMESLFGYAKEEMLDRGVDMLLPTRFQAVHASQRGGYFSTPHVRPMGAGLGLWARRKDGTEFPVEISLSPLQTENGMLVTAAVRDVTERTRVEHEVKELNASLERHAAELEIANRELESFSYSVSHDLRAPLRSIDGFSAALLEDYARQLPDEARNFLERVRAAAQRMGELIDDLLELSRISRVAVSAAPVDLSVLAQNIADELQKTDPGRRVAFKISKSMQVHADRALLRIALENLMNNAWKFTSKIEQGRIEVGAKQNGGLRAFYVRDNGVGFDEKYADKLFVVFQRLHPASDFPGTGVGLATVQRVIHKHGGRVWAQSKVDQGATFYFTLQPEKV